MKVSCRVFILNYFFNKMTAYDYVLMKVIKMIHPGLVVQFNCWAKNCLRWSHIDVDKAISHWVIQFKCQVWAHIKFVPEIPFDGCFMRYMSGGACGANPTNLQDIVKIIIFIIIMSIVLVQVSYNSFQCTGESYQIFQRIFVFFYNQIMSGSLFYQTLFFFSPYLKCSMCCNFDHKVMI